MKQTDLFANEGQHKHNAMPLALRMTPQTLDDYVGQRGIIGPDKLLRRSIEADRVSSLIFFGPPGTGKSALSRIIAKTTKSHFEETNAVVIGINEIRAIIKQAKCRLETAGEKTILLIDEIHHFNRTQQDALLPDVERGVISLIGITTENPFFYVNAALLSRSQLFEFKALGQEDLEKIVHRALQDKENGLGKLSVNLDKQAMRHLIDNSLGDARRLLNALETGVLSTAPDQNGVRQFTVKVAEESLQKKQIQYDKSGDEHYDHISAFIKSIRGSNPDAALYWMAKMLKAGEDPRFIARRIMISAAEDIGNADPRALTLAVSTLQAVEFIGMPEAKIPLAQAVTYLSTAPKSNAAYMALHRAEKEAAAGKPRSVPDHLKDSNRDGKELGHGAGYQYPHDSPGHFVKQDYWTDPVILYEPSDQGYEVTIGERLSRWRKKG